MNSSSSITGNKIKSFLRRANSGESVYIYEVRDAFMRENSTVECTVETVTDEVKKWQIPIPFPDSFSGEENDFIRNYFFSNIYNIISVYGGKNMILNVPSNEKHIKDLCFALNDVFQINSILADRCGYGKCLNVTDRMNAAFGHAPFKFIISNKNICTEKKPSGNTETNTKSRLKKAVEAATKGV